MSKIMRRALFFAAALCFASCQTVGGPSAELYFTDSGVVSLAKAAADGDTKTLSRLLAAGSDVNARGRAGMTPLIWALLHQNKTGFTFLLEHGANPNLQLTSTVDEIVAEGNSAMSFAARHEDIWYLETVLKHGGDPNLMNSSLHPPIFFSLFTLRTENAKLLIAAGANLNWQDRHGDTPLITAVILNQYDLACAMLEAGADPMIKTKNGDTVLSYTRFPLVPEREHWRQKLLGYLKAKGVDVEHGR